MSMSNTTKRIKEIRRKTRTLLEIFFEPWNEKLLELA